MFLKATFWLTNATFFMNRTESDFIPRWGQRNLSKGLDINWWRCRSPPVWPLGSRSHREGPRRGGRHARRQQGLLPAAQHRVRWKVPGGLPWGASRGVPHVSPPRGGLRGLHGRRWVRERRPGHDLGVGHPARLPRVLRPHLCRGSRRCPGHIPGGRRQPGSLLSAVWRVFVKR